MNEIVLTSCLGIGIVAGQPVKEFSVLFVSGLRVLCDKQRPLYRKEHEGNTQSTQCDNGIADGARLAVGSEQHECGVNRTCFTSYYGLSHSAFFVTRVV